MVSSNFTNRDSGGGAFVRRNEIHLGAPKPVWMLSGGVSDPEETYEEDEEGGGRDTEVVGLFVTGAFP